MRAKYKLEFPGGQEPPTSMRPGVDGEPLSAECHGRTMPLARDLDIGAEVIRKHVASVTGEQLSAVFVAAATFVRSRVTFLD